MRLAGSALAVGLALVLGVGARAAAADPDANVERADALFGEAQALLQAGNLEAACAKFDASLELNGQAIGTLLNVARCDARLGKIAKAVALYTEARERGREQKLQVYVDAAADQLSKLTPLVPHLAIAFTAPLDGMKITIDDQPVTVAAAADLPLDPGAHSITVTAPGRAPFEAWVKLAKSEHKALAVPALGPAATTQAAPRSGRRLAGELAAIGGGALLLTGVSLGVVAKLHYDDAIQNECGGTTRCSADGFAKTESARSLGTTGTVIGAIGLVAGSVGAVLWLRAPSGPAERGVALAPMIGGDRAGLAAIGRF